MFADRGNTVQRSNPSRNRFLHWALGSLVLWNVATGCNEISEPEGSGSSAPDLLDFADFQQFVEPMFSRRGCSASACHGGQGSGELLLSASLNPAADFNAVLNLTFPSDPSASPLVRKPLAVTQGGEIHAGGDIFADTNDRDYQMLLKWIAGVALQ